MKDKNIYKEAPEGYKYIFTQCITRKGKRICMPKGKVFRFLVKI